MHSLLILTLLARGPLPIPDTAWTKPAAQRADEQQRSRERVHAEQQQPQPEPVATEESAQLTPRPLEERRFAISLGVGTLVGWPSLEVEVLPVQHVSGYVSGEASLLVPGYGVQAGVRLRPMVGLVGPWLDVHVRHSHFSSFTFTLDEELSPGAALGFSVQSRGGFLFSAGIGASFVVKTSQTRYGAGVVETPVFPLFVPTGETSSEVGAQPELKVQVGWAF